MTAPRTTSGALRRPARRTLRSSPRLLAASRRFGAPRPRTPRTVAPIETSGAGGPPASPNPSDLAAFASLRPWALAMARRLGARSGEDEDATQEALLRAARDLDTFLAPLDVPRETALRRWIVGILAHVLSEARDKAKRLPVPMSQLQHAPRYASSPDAHARTEARAELRHLMRTFPGATSPERWRTWLAFEVDGVPVAEIARQEGAPEATIYNRVRLARRDLAAMLARQDATVRGTLARDRMTRKTKGRR